MNNAGRFAPCDEEESDDEMVVRRAKVIVSPFIIPTSYGWLLTIPSLPDEDENCTLPFSESNTTPSLLRRHN
jgi:hypothetical protein